VEDFKDLLYADYMTRTNKEYQLIASRTKATDLFVDYLEEYNMNFRYGSLTANTFGIALGLLWNLLGMALE
jgi:hypothetical protein